MVADRASKFQFAYLIVAIVNCMVGVSFLIFWCRVDRTQLSPVKSSEMSSDSESRSEYVVREDRLMLRVQILAGLFVFFFFYVGMEVAYGSLISTFAVDQFDWAPSQGALLASCFWGAFAIGRFLGIFLARCISPVTMLICDLVICTTAFCVVTLGGPVAKQVGLSYETIVWVCSAAIGFGMSSVFPAGISWAERYIKATGLSTSVFVIGSSLGEMIIPGVCGVMMVSRGETSLMTTLLVCAAVSLVVFCIMSLFARRAGERYDTTGALTGADSSDDLVPLVISDDDERREDGAMATTQLISNGTDSGVRSGSSGVPGTKRVTFDPKSVENSSS